MKMSSIEDISKYESFLDVMKSYQLTRNIMITYVNREKYEIKLIRSRAAHFRRSGSRRILMLTLSENQIYTLCQYDSHQLWGVSKERVVAASQRFKMIVVSPLTDERERVPITEVAAFRSLYEIQHFDLDVNRHHLTLPTPPEVAALEMSRRAILASKDVVMRQPEAKELKKMDLKKDARGKVRSFFRGCLHGLADIALKLVSGASPEVQF